MEMPVLELADWLEEPELVPESPDQAAGPAELVTPPVRPPLKVSRDEEENINTDDEDPIPDEGSRKRRASTPLSPPRPGKNPRREDQQVPEPRPILGNPHPQEDDGEEPEPWQPVVELAHPVGLIK